MLLFTGSGSTAAVCKMVHLLGLRQWSGGSSARQERRGEGRRRRQQQQQHRRRQRRRRGGGERDGGGMDSDAESVASVSAAGDSPSSHEELERDEEEEEEEDDGNDGVSDSEQSEGESSSSGRCGDDAADRPVVFACPIGHHSNLLPWRESGAEVVPVRADGRVGVDLRHLEELLRRYRRRRLKVGSCYVCVW